MTRIVTTTYKPPPKRKERKLAEITGPAVVTAKGSRRPVRSGEGSGGRGWDDPPVLEQAGDASLTRRASGGAHIPANDDRKSAIVLASGVLAAVLTKSLG